jgi:hypothetical protein
MSAAFRIRRVYFDQIKAGTKTNEIRQDKPYWRKVAMRYPRIAVFVCGKDVHRREITSITVGAKAEEVLGRPLSAQGIKDIGTGSHIVFYLGQAAPEPSSASSDAAASEGTTRKMSYGTEMTLARNRRNNKAVKIAHDDLIRAKKEFNAAASEGS